MERLVPRKPRLYFDVSQRPIHVTFDDGRAHRRNFPWMHYVEARWDYMEPDTIRVVISDLVVIIVGRNLAPLFLAIEEQTLLRIRAQPELGNDREHEPDCFAREIQFLKLSGGAMSSDQFEFDLGGA